MLLIIVKHVCGCIKFYRVDARNDIEAAKFEAELSRCKCDNCK